MKTSNSHTRFLPVALLMWLLCVPLTSSAETYTYDATGRLTSVTYPDGSLVTYGYDANGNIISRTTGIVTDTTNPVVTAPANITTEATGSTTAVNLGVATATDNVDGPLTPTADITGPFTVGEHTITWSATDAANNTGTATQLVTIVDTTPPVITVPADITVISMEASTPVNVGIATATDLIDGSVSVASDSTGTFTLGTHTVTWTATDTRSNTSIATQSVTVGYGCGDANEDRDNDNIPDCWELLYGLDPLKTGDASLDNDEDNILNIDEYLQGSNPLVANAVNIQKEGVKRAEIAKSILIAKYGINYIPPLATGALYNDVQAGGFHAGWIEKLTLDGISEGCAANLFCPDMVVTKEQLAKLLLKAKHGSAYTPPAANEPHFDDVVLSSFAVDWIEALFTEGITEGCDANNFCPNEVVTVEAFESMLNKAFP